MIGYCVEIKSLAKELSTNSQEGAFLCFDSGRILSFPDANYHTFTSGTIGSGKTKSVIIPGVKARIEAGHSGLWWI